MLKRSPVLLSFIVMLSMLSFVVAAETESESFSFEESSTFSVMTSEFSSEAFTEGASEENSALSGSLGEQEAIINRLDMIYTLGLFVVGVFAALLVIFILWRVLDVFLF